MNKETITVMTEPEQDMVKMDLLDLLAELFLKWKKILIFLLIGAVLGCGGALLKDGAEKKPVTDEDIAKAKSVVATDKAKAAEQLFFQYVSYKELQEDFRSYYSVFANSDVNLDNTMQMRSEYYIVSTIKDLDTVFIKLALTEDDYQAMRTIAPDEQAGAAIYDRIAFTTAYNEITDNTDNKISMNNTIKLPAQEDRKEAYLINVELYGQSEEQCREMMAVVEAAFQRETEELKVLDPDIKLETLGEQFNHNVANYIQLLRKKNIDSMTTSETELRDLKDKVNDLPSEEKKYFNLLMEQYDDTFAVKERVSWKKWMVIGAFLGAVTAVGVVFFNYALGGEIQSTCELEQNGRLLNRVFIKGNNNLFGKLAAGLIHADETDPTIKADMVATDINIMMEKSGKNQLMLLCSREDSDAATFAEQVKAGLLAKNADLKVSIGNPLCSADELEMAAQADMGVSFAELKKSKRTMLREWRQLCERYKLPLAGAVAVQRCW